MDAFYKFQLFNYFLIYKRKAQIISLMIPDPVIEQKKKSKFEQLNQQLSPQKRQKWELQQAKVKKLIIDKDDFNWNLQQIKYICGVDLSAHIDNQDLACVALIVFNIKEKKIEYQDNEIIQINEPYVPGFLAFRQVPPLYALFMKLKKNFPQKWPQLLIVDGNGILHQNACGLACHLGVLLDIPSLGVGKKFFSVDGIKMDKVKELCEQKIKKQGDFALIEGQSGRIWGAALRTGKNAKNPVYVSTGTKISLQTAIKCVIQVSEYRVPEPVRLADKRSREIIEKIDGKQIQKYKKYEMIYLDEL